MQQWTSGPRVPSPTDQAENALSAPAYGGKQTPSDAPEGSFAVRPPVISLPKGGGALKGMGEKFQSNAVNGTASLSIPLPFSKTRGDLIPALSLDYNSGAGNSEWGLGWQLGLSSIQRRTDQRLPLYRDALETDTFMFTGAEDLVPVLQKDNSGNWIADEFTAPTGERVKRYRPRIESGFSRIERIQPAGSPVFYWKVTSRNNVITIYGRSATARIADPVDPAKIFKWLPELSYDDKGNCFEMQYVQEDLKNVPGRLHEANRLSGVAPCTNGYLKGISYGNRAPYYPDPHLPYNPPTPASLLPPPPPGTAPQNYFFEMIADYGDHNDANPTPDIQQDWPCRIDPFSNYKPGFEIRSFRLCRRILFFHNFSELNDGPGSNPTPCLVRSLDLNYKYFLNPLATVTELRDAEIDIMISVRQTGYLRNTTGGYDKKSLPPLEFSYQELDWDRTVQTISPEGLVNDPVGLGANYQWSDLWNEGISGILTEQAGGWYYKTNLGGGHFSPAQPVAPKPSFTGLSGGALQLQDLEADGRKFIVSTAGPVKGYFELSDQPVPGEGGLNGGGHSQNGHSQDGQHAGHREWQPFRPFAGLPNVDFNDPDTRFIDLNGDGRPDLVVSEECVFTWYANKGTLGYEAAEMAAKPFDREKGPALVFWDPLQSIFMADMSGDGLTDIVRIRNGEISYWPNRGYGNFGARISMDDAPVFDLPDLFDSSYLQLADINGTGATDIIYLGQNKCRVWLNLAGNGWSEPVAIDPFPSTESPNRLMVVDLLGNGTACLVWSSPLPGYSDSPMRYIDLLGGNKPFIMNGYKNNLGKETSWEYKSSTKYYLQDKLAGKPWVTKLPFPVQCMAAMSVTDKVTNATFRNEYSYHQGYYDHPEKEFRGFGRVEQIDTDSFDNYVSGGGGGSMGGGGSSGGGSIVDETLYQPPVLTKTWFHTGAFFGENRILDQFAHEYFQNPDFSEYHLPATILPAGMTAIEMREALRACKGMVLRQEVYGLDDAPVSSIPYSVAEHNCHIQMLQPRVFLVTESEAISYYYERNTRDPRIAHSLNIGIDELGNVLQSAAVVYPRQSPPAGLPAAVTSEQQKQHITYTLSRFTNDLIDPAHYRLRVLCDTQGFELTGVNAAANYFSLTELENGFASASPINYEDVSDGSPQKRGIEEQRTLFLKNDTTGPLPLGLLGSLGLAYESYRKTLTLGLLTASFGTRVAQADLITALTEGKYTRSDDYKASGLFPATDADDECWLPSGKPVYPANPAPQFYLPDGYIDAFGNTTTVRYYADYFLLVDQTVDAIGNMITIRSFDWRSLSPQSILDINDNVSAASFDILGLMVGSAIGGKGGAQADDLINFDPNPGDAQLAAFFNDPVTGAPDLLQHATSRFIYDLSVIPVRVASILRETHYQQTLIDGSPSNLQLGFEYSDGLGHVAMKKIQAEPGLAKALDGSGNLIEVDTTPNLRWIGNGRTVLNNKGKPVKQYEPYFSVDFAYEDAPQLVEIGVTPILYYDPTGRLIKTDFPDGTFTKTEFNAWQQTAYDQNDTVNDSDWYTLRTTGALATDPRENQAALKASMHYNTPAVVHLDSLGRPFYSIAHNRFRDPNTNIITDEFYATQTVLDIEGNMRRMIDARGNTVMAFSYGMTANQVYSDSMDAARRWMLTDCMGKPAYAWDSKDQQFHTTYDALRRPLQNLVKQGAQNAIAFANNVYGEGQPNDKTLNLRGQAYQQFDQAGIITLIALDFKGNVLQVSRKLCDHYQDNIDWNISQAMEGETFSSASVFDALNRPVSQTLPDASIVGSTYDGTGLLNTVKARIKGSAMATVFVQGIGYDAKGQRQDILYGNNTKTSYQYDPDTFRLIQLLTTGSGGSTVLQKLTYTFDPVGNISYILDEAQQTVFFNNSVATPSCDYRYDAIYRLITATGREHIGQNQPPSAYDASRTNLPQPGEGAALRTYTENYRFDAVGNILQMIHAAGPGSWTRSYAYEPGNNRLQSNTVGGNTENFSYDVHGNILTLSSLQSLGWNFKDEFKEAGLGGGGTAYYVYDGSGQRVRKIVERQDGSKEERIYLGSVEIYRGIGGGGMTQDETQTLHIRDGACRMAMVETITIRNGATATDELIRYQYGNHLGSSSLELNEHATIISYEEYYPYGCTSYQAMNAAIRAAAKRYRYTAMERDEESGLEYHSARYYLPWAGRWLSADPSGINAGPNLYLYCSGNPIMRTDSTGLDDDDDDYCYSPFCGSFSPVAWIKDTVIGTGEGAYEEGKKIVEIPDKIQDSVNSNIKYTIDHPSQALENFADNLQTAPTELLKGTFNSILEAGEQYDEMTDNFANGHPRAGGRILGKGLVIAGVSVVTDGIGDEILAADVGLDSFIADDAISAGEDALVKDGAADAVKGPRNKFRPRSQAIAQEEVNTCVSASCKMVLRDLGHSGIPEKNIASTLNTEGAGAYISDIPQALRSMDIPIGRKQLISDVATRGSGVKIEDVAAALKNGDRVIVGYGPRGYGHAVVVDTMYDGMVTFRDPALGMSVRVSEQQFKYMLGPHGGRMARFILTKK
jgi:RHS repeat-associated protein